MLTHALYDGSMSCSNCTSHRRCDLTLKASVSMRKCADWVNLKFIYPEPNFIEPLSSRFFAYCTFFISVLHAKPLSIEKVTLTCWPLLLAISTVNAPAPF